MPAERVGTRRVREILRLTFAANCTSPVLPCAVLFRRSVRRISPRPPGLSRATDSGGVAAVIFAGGAA